MTKNGIKLYTKWTKIDKNRSINDQIWIKIDLKIELKLNIKWSNVNEKVPKKD